MGKRRSEDWALMLTFKSGSLIVSTNDGRGSFIASLMERKKIQRIGKKGNGMELGGKYLNNFNQKKVNDMIEMKI